MTASQPKRQRRGDRLLDPHASASEMACDYAVGPFDRAVREMDRAWGVERLPELVSVETAQRWAKALSALNEALAKGDPDAVALAVRSCLKGLAVMNAEAEAANSPKAHPAVIEYEQDGMRFGIMRDDAYWPVVQEQYPELAIYSLRQIARMIKEDGNSPTPAGRAAGARP